MDGDDADFFDEPIASDSENYPSFSKNQFKNKTDSDNDQNKSRNSSHSGALLSDQQSPEPTRGRRNTYSSDDATPRSNRSRSRSYSSDYERTGDKTNDNGSRTSGAKNVGRKTKDTYDSDRSGSRYNSDSEDEAFRGNDYSPRSKSSLKIEARVPSAASKRNEHNNSLSDFSSDHSRENSPRHRDDQNRPKTSASKREDKYSDSFSETESLSDADSDVTDVSPLNSPHRNQNGRSIAGKPPKSPGYTAGERHSSSYYKANGSSSANLSDIIDSHSDNDKMNLNILMQAVMEMENRQNPDYEKRERIAQSRRVLFVPEKAAPHNRKNFSFSNDKTVTIDKENQRLMQQIMKYTTGAAKARKKQTKTTRPVQPRMTPSAVNRLREQQRIERENMAFLKRLQKTTASKTIKRDHLLNDYEKKTIAGHSVAAAHAHLDYSSSMSMLQKKSFNTSYVDSEVATVNLQGRGKWPRPSSAPTYKSASVSDPATVTLQTKRTRPTSASTYKVPPDQRPVVEGKRRPQSAHVGSSAATHKLVSQYRYKSDKPDWDSRW